MPDPNSTNMLPSVHLFKVPESVRSGSLGQVFRELDHVLEKYEAVIGLEVHCQLATQSKLFSAVRNISSAEQAFGDCSNNREVQPNLFIDEVSLALPGTLPVLNEQSVRLAIRMGLAVGANVENVSVFTRKNYFYPDLPKGYQITQYDRPICTGGSVQLSNGRLVKINRIQLEEDAGKTVHGDADSFVDFNRAGVGLIEIVSEPCLQSPFEASEYLKRLHRLAVFYGVSDGDLERGNFRADANVSIRLRGSKQLETRTELKNINSFRFLERAIAHEILRQVECKESGQAIVLETRGYDSERDITFSQRSKETAQDYRYFPDPDLPPLVVSAVSIDAERLAFPEQAFQAYDRLVTMLAISETEAAFISETAARLKSFQSIVDRCTHASPRAVAGFFCYVMINVPSGIDDAQTGWVAAALDAVARDVISPKTLKSHFFAALASGLSMEDWAKREGLLQVAGDDEVAELAQTLLNEFPEQAKELASGKEKIVTFFVGQAMKRTQGAISPIVFTVALKNLIKKE